MKIITIDIEAHDWTKFVQGGFYDGKEYLTFDTARSLYNQCVKQQYRGYTIFAHFGGRYDFRFFLPFIAEQEKDFEIIENFGRIICLKIRRNNNVYKFADSFNLIPVSLAKATASFKVEHSKGFIDFDKEQFNPNSKDHQEYLKNDCLGLYEVLHKYANWGENTGTLKLTLASQTMQVFRKSFYTKPIDNISKDDEDFIRRGYFGGRCEIFKMYGKNLNYYDFNSLYPSVMLEKMPVRSPQNCDFEKPDKIGFYYIEVKIDEKIKIPPIPVIIKGKLIFPVGKFKAHVTSADLKTLRLLKQPYKVIKGIYFNEDEAIFKTYINKMFEIKRKAKPDSPDYLMSKLYMNSLYGKFAQSRMKNLIIRSEWNEAIKEGYIPFMEDFNLFIKETETKSKNIRPFIASYITSLARNKLYEHMLKIGFDHIFYTDTDSIITDKKLKSSKELGELKEEYSNISQAVFLQPKAYCLLFNDKEILKIKGFSQHNLNFKDFKQALDNQNLDYITAEINRLTGFKEQLRRFKNLDLKRIKQIKRLREFYNKRIILDNLDTLPYNIDDFT